MLGGSNVSGAKDRRPELDKLMADANRRKFDAVVVWRFGRFARSVSHLLRALEMFRSLGLEFVSNSEAIDTSRAVGKMTVLGAVAELERSLIVERVRAVQNPRYWTEWTETRICVRFRNDCNCM